MKQQLPRETEFIILDITNSNSTDLSPRNYFVSQKNYRVV